MQSNIAHSRPGRAVCPASCGKPQAQNSSKPRVPLRVRLFERLAASAYRFRLPVPRSSCLDVIPPCDVLMQSRLVPHASQTEQAEAAASNGAVASANPLDFDELTELIRWDLPCQLCFVVFCALAFAFSRQQNFLAVLRSRIYQRLSLRVSLSRSCSRPWCCSSWSLLHLLCFPVDR